MAESRSRIAVWTIRSIARDLVRLLSASCRSRTQPAAGNLFFRKQLTLHLERQVKPRPADDATRARGAALAGRLASPSDGREARRAHPMASQGLPVVLAAEVSVRGRPRL